ncbi:signal peptidase I [Thermohalobacter berrensis]|uniref:Signal peptidase I n=1 Tax=Thermohalobacter berrensis TaxID=99594 RepID=A0A419TBC2_9FIRM|nr:signal peptidase I [Thermohalobacter berrensis]RKD34752.1 signal peptidase I [Thermohalobacter berrensis]
MSKDKIKKEIYEWIKSIGLAVIIAILIKTFIFNSTYVLGSSMYPTLHEKDRLFTNKVVYFFNEPQRGDIVVLKAPDDPEKDYIKRVIAIEGDLIAIKNGKVYVNNKLLKEEYIREGSYTYGNIKLKVPQGHVFVLGDNRERGASKDSRYFGPVPIDLIKGKASFRYFPFDNRFGFLY